MSNKRDSGRIYRIDRIAGLVGNIGGLSPLAAPAGGKAQRKDIGAQRR